LQTCAVSVIILSAKYMTNFSSPNKKESTIEPQLTEFLKQPELKGSVTKTESESVLETSRAAVSKPEKILEAVTGGVQKNVTQQGLNMKTAGASDPDLKKIEDVLAEDLSDVYLGLDAAHRRLFKEEGERASNQIKNLFDRAQATAKKVLDIIKRWLMMIPHVNKFFLEQEAKIKTDKIMKISTQFKNKQKE